MSFADDITRVPDPYDADRGREAAELFPDASGSARDLIAGAGGCSPYLRGLMSKEVEWLGEMLAGDPQQALEATLADIDDLAMSDIKSGLRKAKRRVAL